MIRSRTRSSSWNRTAEPSRARASPSRRPRTSSSGTCWSSSPGSRAANTSPTGSASRRRATKASVSADAWSSHCASSTTHSSGCSSAASESRLSTARPTRNRSGAAPGAQPEHDLERLALRRREPLEPVEQRRAQLMQARRRPAPSRTPPRPPARRSGPAPTRPGTRAAPSSRCRPRRAGPATGSRPGGCPRSSRPAARTRRPARGGSRGRHPTARPCWCPSNDARSSHAWQCDRDQGVTSVHYGRDRRAAWTRQAAITSPTDRGLKGDPHELVLRPSTPEGPGSVSGAPNLPAGFTDTFTSRYIDTGELRLHAVIGGEGPPLLLVHGWPETWYAWRLLMPALARDFEVIAVDQRGIGLSDKPAGRVRHRHPRRRPGRADGRARPRAVRRGRPRHRIRDQLRAGRGSPGPGRPRGPRRDPRASGGGSLAAAVRPRAAQRPALAHPVQPGREAARTARQRDGRTIFFGYEFAIQGGEAARRGGRLLRPASSPTPTPCAAASGSTARSTRPRAERAAQEPAADDARPGDRRSGKLRRARRRRR